MFNIDCIKMFNKENELILFLKIFEEKTLYLHLLKSFNIFFTQNFPEFEFYHFNPKSSLTPWFKSFLMVLKVDSS